MVSHVKVNKPIKLYTAYGVFPTWHVVDKIKDKDKIITHMVSPFIYTILSVFSPAYLRDSGPLPLHYWFNFDVGFGWSQWL